MKLSIDQQAALDEVMLFLIDPDETEMAIWGPAGTGKTVLTSFILKEARKRSHMMKLLLNQEKELSVHLTSTTNKAAKTLSEATLEEARTIHSLLGLKVYNDFSTGRVILKRSTDSDVIQHALIIIDEAGMINKDLLKTVRELTFKCKVLYIGDSYQLAPVMENISPVFANVDKQVKLTTIQRQAAGSPIIKFSTGFRSALDTGAMPLIKSVSTEIQVLSYNDFTTAIKNTFPITGINDARILAWTNTRVHQYNDYVRGLVGMSDYEVGEKVLTNQPILGKNRNSGLSTDSIAEITGIYATTKDHIDGWNITLNKKLTVFQARNQAEVTAYIRNLKNDKNWPEFFRVKESFADLRPIHACTVNKSQGSTYDQVFIDLDDIGKCTKNSDIIRMLYTGITRAKYRVTMTGSLPKRLYE